MKDHRASLYIFLISTVHYCYFSINYFNDLQFVNILFLILYSNFEYTVYLLHCCLHSTIYAYTVNIHWLQEFSFNKLSAFFFFLLMSSPVLRYAGVLLGLTNTFGTIPGVVAPNVVGLLTNDVSCYYIHF